MTINIKNGGGLIGEILKTNHSFLPTLRVGDLVEGKILEKGSAKLFIDLGKYGTGAVYRGELQNAKEYVKNLNIGDAVHAKVIDIDNDEGLVELSLSEADKQKSWTEVQELKEKEEILKVKVAGFNKGGLMAEVRGLSAFLPVSQLSQDHYPKVSEEEKSKILQSLQLLVGSELEVKIIDVNPRTSKLIVSEKAVQELSARDLAKNYTVGQVIEGIISGVADFGAFLRFTDNPAVEGFVHVSEIDWRIIENPKEVLKVDEVVKAKIVDIKDGRISLSLKALKEDPWTKVSEYFKDRDEVTGTVYSLNQFGAVVNLDHGFQGIIRVTEFGGVPEMKKELSQGEQYSFIIENVKPTERRINLKLKK
ncbi:S1 RNA-binding domain-containing protein [Patescibacteria group bacterium]|nr:S1 RNA-binding domain-containing protein [Patescibacteria group bacterium]